MTTTAFSMRLPEELKTSLKEISELSHRSQSQVAVKVIAEHIVRNKWKMQATQEAKILAENGKFISHAATDAWLDSWGSENELASPGADVSSKVKLI